MESTMMKVEVQLPRKRNTTSITTRKVMIMVSTRVLMVLMISVELSLMMLISISEGRVFSMFFSYFFTSLMTFTVLAPDCF